MSYRPGCFRSHRQQVRVPLSGQTGTATLSTVIDPSVSLLCFQGLESADNTGQVGWDDFAIGTITNGTTITATRPGSGTWGLVWVGVVIEFLRFFTFRAECGSITIPDGSTFADIAITSAPNAIVLCTGWSNANSTPSAHPGQMIELMASVSQIDDTHLRAQRSGTAAAWLSTTVGYSLWAPKI